MSMTSTVADSRHTAGSGLLAEILKALQRCWVAYINWRIEQAAVATLRAMSDHDLNDLGLARSEIAAAVKCRCITAQA